VGNGDLVRKCFGDTRVALADIFELLFEILPRRAARRYSPLTLGVRYRCGPSRLPLPDHLFVRDQFDIWVVGLF
jgi:hypothetical protein